MQSVASGKTASITSDANQFYTMLSTDPFRGDAQRNHTKEKPTEWGFTLHSSIQTLGTFPSFGPKWLKAAAAAAATERERPNNGVRLRRWMAAERWRASRAAGRGLETPQVTAVGAGKHRRIRLSPSVAALFPHNGTLTKLSLISFASQCAPVIMINTLALHQRSRRSSFSSRGY